MATPPEWAQFKIRMYLADCWMREDDDGTVWVEGVNWSHDILLRLCSWIHNYLVAPFLSPEEQDAGFYFSVLEIYDEEKAREYGMYWY